MLDIPFYVWDFADRFKADVIDDFVASYERGETPNPCVRCNEKIKFSALAGRALALGFDALATGHYARLADGRLRRAVDHDKDQSYVLGVLTAEQLRHAVFPIGDTPRRRSARRPRNADWPWPTSPTATTSASSRPVTPGRSSARGSGCGPARWSTRAARYSPNTKACTDSRSVSARPGIAGPGPDGQPRYVTGIDAESGTVRVGGVEDLEVSMLRGERRCSPPGGVRRPGGMPGAGAGTRRTGRCGRVL